MDPTTTITRRDLSLTYNEFSARVQRSGYAGLKVLPPLGVPQEATTFQRLNVKDNNRKPEDTRRREDGTYARDEGRFSADSYQTIEHGVEERVDYGKVEKWGDLVRIENIARERAIDRIRSEFGNQTWTAFNLVWFESQSPDLVADKLQIGIEKVYVAKSRVLKRLREEVLRLSEDLPVAKL